MFGLISQMKRSGISSAANIAEGWSRNSRKSFHHFLDILRGCLAELYTHTEIARRLEFISDKRVLGILDQTEEISKMIHSMQVRIRT